jgi:hypothetical protein
MPCHLSKRTIFSPEAEAEIVRVGTEMREPDLIPVWQAGWEPKKLAELAGALASPLAAQNIVLESTSKDTVAFAEKRFAAKTPAMSVNKMAERMNQIEYCATTLVTAKTLTQLNFSTKIIMRGKRTAIEATRMGKEKVLILVEDKGSRKGVGVRTDFSVNTSKAFDKIRQQFEEKLEENGMTLDDEGMIEDHDHPFDPDGGHLFEYAREMRTKDLALGLLLHQKGGASAPGTPSGEAEFDEGFYQTAYVEQYCQSLYDSNGRENARKEKV